VVGKACELVAISIHNVPDNPDVGERVDILYQSGAVKRMHTIPVHGQHLIAEHVYGTQIIAVELCRLNGFNETVTGRILQTLLYHDAPELVTGDIPAPMKWDNPELRAAFDKIDEEFYLRSGIHLPPLTIKEHKVVKAADYLDLLFRCLYERRLGNRNDQILQIKVNVISYFRKQKIDTEIEGVDQLVGYVEEAWKDLA
jgi:5'-deoxynucleotidase YfbR-like HD superfamily hydrolase